MGFARQLRILVWKNLTLRRRNWVRLLADLIWPLALFMIEVGVRTRVERTNVKPCYFDEKAMPSAGFFPFAQTFFCTIGNQCQDSPKGDFSPMFESYNGSMLNEMYADVTNSLSSNVKPTDIGSIYRVYQDFTTLRTLANEYMDEGGQSSSTGLSGAFRISKLFNDTNKVKELMLWWSSNVGDRVSNMQQNEILDSKDEVNTTSSNENKTIKVWSTEEIDMLFNGEINLFSVPPSILLSSFRNSRDALCTPDVTGKIIIIPNLDESQVVDTLAPLCLSANLNDTVRLVNELHHFLDWDQIEEEMQNIIQQNGQSELSFKDWKKVGNLGRNFTRDIVDTESFKKVISVLGESTRDLFEIARIFSARAETLDDVEDEYQKEMIGIAKVHRFVCGERKMYSMDNSKQAVQRFKERLNIKIIKKVNGSDDGDDDKSALMSDYKYDNTTSKECNDIMKGMERSPVTAFFWQQLKPLIRGKILYTPETKATLQLMQMVNTSFSPFLEVQGLSEKWLQNKDQIRSVLTNTDNQKLFTDMVISQIPDDTVAEYLSNNSMLKPFFAALDSIGNVDEQDKQLLNNTFLNISQTIDKEDIREFISNKTLNERINQGLNLLEDVMKNLSTYISCFEFDKFEPMASEYEMETKGTKLVEQRKLWAGLVFLLDGPPSKESDTLPPFVKYKIRMDSDTVDTTERVSDRFKRPGPRMQPMVDLKYITFGFSYLQDMLEHSIISLQSGRNLSEIPGITLNQFPYPCYISDRFIRSIAGSFPMFMTMSWIFGSAILVKSIVYEKEQRLKETMKVMGLTNGVFWMAWFIDSFIIMSFSSAVLTFILTYGNLLIFADPSLIFVFLVSYTVSTTFLSFLMSTIFSRANISAAAGGLLFFATYLPYQFLRIWDDEINDSIRMGCSLFNNVAFGFGCRAIAEYEQSAVGVKWSNIMDSGTDTTDYSLGKVLSMFWIDALVYWVLTWYIEAVFPGEYGIAKPWYFFVQPTYWCGKDCKQIYRQWFQRKAFKPNMVGDEFGAGNEFAISEMDSEDLNGLSAGKGGCFEPEPTDLPMGVSIQHLSKVYDNGKVAVEDLTLNFYEGQITSFLGHNGAGKTTTMSILTGLFPPSAGTAKIQGLDIRTDMDDIRKFIGMCPQHNVLFDRMTVIEHFWFYGRLRGRTTKKVLEEAEEMVKSLGLSEKRNAISSSLSGGMKRKLSVATAFVGGSKVVVLDEPTAGVDPHARRAIWDLLIKFKKGRTIIMSTHFMDEADLLGDRIAIINNGKLICVGSSLFLRSAYGNGYYLTLVKDDWSGEGDSVDGKGEKEKDILGAHEIEEDDALEVDPINTESEDVLNNSFDQDAPRNEEEGRRNLMSCVDQAFASGSSSASASTRRGEERSLSIPRRDPLASSTETDIEESLKAAEGPTDEGISDIAKDSHFIINPSKGSQEQALIHPITKTIEKFIPDAKLLEQRGESEIVYILPTRDMANFEPMLATLDHNKERLKIKSYGISDTTLEEIFLKVASNVKDGEIVREIKFEDVTDYGNYASRVRSASSRSTDPSVMPKYPADPEQTADVQELLESSEAFNPNVGVTIAPMSDTGHRRQPSNIGVAAQRPRYRSENSTSECRASDKTGFKKNSSVNRNFPPPIPEYSKKSMFIKHIWALTIKRFHHTKRNKKGFIFEILLPAIFVLFALLVTLLVPYPEPSTPLEMNPWLFPPRPKNPEGSFNDRPKLEGFMSNKFPEAFWPKRYAQEVLSPYSMGTKCLYGSTIKDGLPCLKNGTIGDFNYPKSANLSFTKKCSCDDGAQKCPLYAEGPVPAKVELASRDIMYNMTRRSVPDYLIKTRLDNIETMYGGFEFGVDNPLSKVNISKAQTDTSNLLKSLVGKGSSEVVKQIINDFGGSVASSLFGSFIEEDAIMEIVDSYAIPKVNQTIEDFVKSNSRLEKLRVWFNNKGYGTPVAYANAANNLILRASIQAIIDEKKPTVDEDDPFADDDFFEDGFADESATRKFGDPSEYGISVWTHPMNLTTAQTAKQGGQVTNMRVAVAFFQSMFVIFALSFVPASFVVFLIEERVSKSKHLQFVSSVKPLPYWIAAILWDISMYMVTATLVLILFILFDNEAFVSETNFGPTVLLMFLYGWATIPMMYPFSFLFETPSTAFVTLGVGNVFIEMITTVTIFVLENSQEEDLEEVSAWLQYVFLIFPQFCLGRGMMDMAQTWSIEAFAEEIGGGFIVDKNPYDFDYLGKFIICMFLLGCFFFALTLAIEFKLFSAVKRLLCSLRDKAYMKSWEKSRYHDRESEDCDVTKERLRVESNSDPITSKREDAYREDVVMVRNLTKFYNWKKAAVDGLTFGVGKGECFGLLGVNGAGKTTTFKMLTGDIDPTDGMAEINGFSILNELGDARRNIGYCPQFDALHPLLTGREHLQLYARLRGLDKSSVQKYVQWGIKRLGLSAYADRVAATYSGGNKRKLSTAIALVGNPSVVFLDEPTTGMDPGARRFLWNCILDVIKSGRSVILTSHSMEECEALCTRLAIMVNGKFLCHGSIQHLKNRFGSGYSLMLRGRNPQIGSNSGNLSPERSKKMAMEKLKELVFKNFPQAELKEEHMSQLMYQLPLKDTWLPQVFHVMESAKGDSNGDLEDYSVSQLTLDDVFIQFASKQSENDETNTKSEQETNDKGVISTSSTKNVAKTEDTSITEQTSNGNKEPNSSNDTNDRHEFVNPILSADRNDFMMSMMSDGNGSDRNSALNSPSNFKGEVELVEVNGQRRSTLENIVDTVALEV